MLFNSHIFIFVFLPVTLLFFFIIGGRGFHRIAIAWLVIASLFFYAWWNPVYLILILFSMVFNYSVGLMLNKQKNGSASKILLTLGITANLGLLGYFKYANFFIDNLNVLFTGAVHLEQILLPLAISFFTFQQISYLVDVYKRESHEYNFLHYCLFVSFFPQLIAGPIVHHREMMPQFAQNSIYKLNLDNVAIGLTVFLFGLFKKVFLADGVAAYATPVFDAAETGSAITFIEAWCGAQAYSLQIYFDFSGYSDMAIGLARMFGILLPLNFYSPYKSHNIIEFWRRWHMTLSRFLREYVYISLGGNRKGPQRRYKNIMITMVLGGLWHGAHWNFMIWGTLHGFYVILNRFWHSLRRSMGHDLSHSTRWGGILSIGITYLATVVAWTFFRAESFGGAMNVLKGMVGLNGIMLPETYKAKLGDLGDLLVTYGVSFANPPLYEGFIEILWLAGLLCIVWVAPNTYQFMYKYRPALETYFQGRLTGTKWQWLAWEQSWRWAIITSILAIVSFLKLNQVSEFLYFNF